MYALNLRLSGRVVLLLALATNLLAQYPEEIKPVPAPPASLSEIRTFEQYATYWSSEPGWETELQLRNNLASEPLTVTPILRFASGHEIPLTAVTIPGNASVSVFVNSALQERAPNLVARPDSYGSVVFRFQAHNTMNLYATAIPSMHGLPVAFRIRAHASQNAADTLPNKGPGSLEGIWWTQRSGLQDVLVINNTSDAQVIGTLSLFDAAGKRWSELLSFTPHQIRRMAMADFLQQAGLSGNFGGLSFEVAASASSIQAVHLMYDEGGKFSGSLEVFHRDPKATVQERAGSADKQWSMRAPMLALSSPDPALGLPATARLQPTVLMRNTTAQKVSAEITLNWHDDSGKGQVKLPQLELAPFATLQVPIWTMQKQLGIPGDAHWALVSLTTNAGPDDVIAIASSRDCTGEYDAETKFVGGRGGRFAGGEWRVDATHNQIAAITNVGSQPTDALLTLHHGAGDKYELRQTIAPGDQMWVNLGQLVRGRVADRNGNFLPVDTNAVTYDLQDMTGSRSLMANDLSVDTGAGQAIPDCPFCCGGYASEYFSPDPVEIIIDGFQDLGIFGVYSCNNQPYSITGDFSIWASSDTAIAEVTYAKAQGVSVGEVTGSAVGEVLGPGECACNFVQRTVQVPVKVTGPPAQLLVIGDTTTFPTNCPNTKLRILAYQIQDASGNDVLTNVQTKEQFASKSVNTCNTTITTDETCSPTPNGLIHDSLSVGCNSVDNGCGYTYKNQQWVWCNGSVSTVIGTVGDLVVQDNKISVRGSYTSLKGIVIKP